MEREAATLRAPAGLEQECSVVAGHRERMKLAGAFQAKENRYVAQGSTVRPGFCVVFRACYGDWFLRRKTSGLVPVQRLNAREKLPGSENPSRNAVSFTESPSPFRYWSASVWRSSSNTFSKVTPSALSLRKSD